MIVNNTCPNVRIFSYSDGSPAMKTFFMMPGVNGSVPETITECAAFKEQNECGLMVIVTPKKPAPVDKTRATMSPDAISKVADNDVVACVLDMDEKAAREIIIDITKRPTLAAILAKEQRASVAAIVEKQIKEIDEANVPARR
jgi:hypothetical protein